MHTAHAAGLDGTAINGSLLEVANLCGERHSCAFHFFALVITIVSAHTAGRLPLTLNIVASMIISSPDTWEEELLPEMRESLSSFVNDSTELSIQENVIEMTVSFLSRCVCEMFASFRDFVFAVEVCDGKGQHSDRQSLHELLCFCRGSISCALSTWINPLQ